MHFKENLSLLRRVKAVQARGLMKALRILAPVVVVALLLEGCGGGRFRTVGPTPPTGAPRAIELYSEISVATLHFPPGIYSLHAADSKGYYYRAPRQIMQHTGAGRVARDGGLFVAKRNRKKIRGYVYWGGGLTHIGKFSPKQFAFRE